MSNMEVRELSQSEFDSWDQWLADQPWAPPFASAWWLEATCRAFGGRPMLLAVLAGDELVGGVALRITDIGPLHVVRPSMIYNPIVMAEAPLSVTQAALDALLGEIALRKLIVRPLKSTPNVVDLRQAAWNHWDLAASWTAVTGLRTWRMDRDVPRAKSRQMRKALSAGVVASVEPADADVLYELVHETILRHGHEPSLTRKQMSVLMQAAGSHGLQTMARGADGTPLSAGFVLTHGTRVAYDVWCGTSTAGLSVGAGVVRSVFVLQELQASGYEFFDWCDVSYPGYSRYKLDFGGEMVTCLSIARQPLWLKAVAPVREALASLVPRRGTKLLHKMCRGS